MTTRKLLIAPSLALALGLASVAAAQTPHEGDRSCLWDQLRIIDKLRLELSARGDEGVPQVLAKQLPQLGPAILEICGFPINDVELDLLARYWIARASLEVATAELQLSGVDPARAEGALTVTAPIDQRPQLALEIMENRDELAGASIRAAIESLDILGPPLDDAQRARVAQYAAARMIVDALHAGVAPPLGQ